VVILLTQLHSVLIAPPLAPYQKTCGTNPSTQLCIAIL